jgi:uracil-DNA glycosylase family 4
MMLDFIGSEFDSLCGDVRRCKMCVRMNDSQRVLNRSVGQLNARLMFIGEAPGRLGADSSGIPFHGDKAGHNFEDLLQFAGINRADVYVTNAVLCNPKDEQGNNATPNTEEIFNCSSYLARQIELINPRIVVTLGAKALEALNHLQEHNLTLKDVRTANNWFGRNLIPLYHPGQRAMLHRSMANQRSDYEFVSTQLDSLRTSKSRKILGKTSHNIGALVEYILKHKNPISYFALHKLFYLIEYYSVLEFGQKMTEAYFVRQKDGPYCTDLHIQKLKKTIANLNVKTFKNGSLVIEKNMLNLFEPSILDEVDIAPDILKLIDTVLIKYGNQNMSKLKQSVYMTRPMRNILFIEKTKNINLYNSPIEFVTDAIHLA